MRRSSGRLFLGLSLFSLVSFNVQADEGMWVYNNLPLQQLKDRHGFDVNETWKDHLMKASVRFNSGGSGSFISSSGLVLTNHHVGAHTLHEISSAKKDYYKDGFLAKTLEEEVPAKGLELNQLESIEDVTPKVEAFVAAAVARGKSSAEARADIVSQLEKESFDKTGLRSDVVPLYQGGQYHLYRYKKYTDVRLVFSPEFGIAFFGGDPDNFEYPRFDLDMCIFRVYENGKPVKIDNYLKWSNKGAQDGDMIFVSGHPGTTNRMYSIDALQFLRDERIRYNLQWLARRENTLTLYRQTSDDAEREAQDDFFSVQNSRKANKGMLKGLQEQDFFAQKQRAELQLRADLMADPKNRDLLGAWDKLTAAQKAYKKILRKRAILELGHGFDSKLFTIARQLVRLAEENTKPNAERLPAFRESGRASLEQDLYSPAPIYKNLEVAMLSASLSEFAAVFGYESALVERVMKGHSADVVAKAMVEGSMLDQVNVRKVIAAGGMNAIRTSRDPMIRAALAVDKSARALQKEYLEKVAEVEKQAYAQVARAIFSLRGASTYPDATFTLRLAFGNVKGYKTADGASIAPLTTMGGAFTHEATHGSRYPWKLPASWHAAKASLDLNAPFNFVSTADIIGGNSGSPVVNRDGELVGLIFDGNIESLTANYMYEDTYSRAVAVHSAGMLEAMNKIYGATALVGELGK